MTDGELWEVAVATPLRRRFIYRIPKELGEPVCGKRVLVPFGPRKAAGYLVAPYAELKTHGFKIKDAIAMPDNEPSLPEELFRFLLEASSYYLHSPGEVFKAALPPQLNQAKKANSKQKLKSKLDPILSLFDDNIVSRDKPLDLNPEQQHATSLIENRLETGGFEGFLLHGITGSGKTEVYLRVISKARELGKGALVLVPEISLTPQLVRNYRARFGDQLTVLHSALTDKERLERWHSLRSGNIEVVIGVRSAIFAPVARLGIIIVDEEHDGSFKQDKGFTYNARDLALLRAARTDAVAILGSATPSLESYVNAERGKLTSISLKHRATGRPLPEVSVVDLTQHRFGPQGQRIVTQPLYEAIAKTLDRNEQVILFLNRRGFAPVLLCSSCGQVIHCAACSVAMTYHKNPTELTCHYCGARRAVPAFCPSCNAKSLEPTGAGTQKAEAILHALFPSARIARMDRDSASGRKGEEILKKLLAREIDILIGTQMVTKGHDIPYVTLVGVLNADIGLNMPDLRASERTFQLLTQVLGRAGRSELGGRAFIQTYSPSHPAIATARTHDFKAYAEFEKTRRQELKYPPYGRLAAIRISATVALKAEVASKNLFAALKDIQAEQKNPDIAFLGPSPAPLTQIQGRYRWHILLKSARQDVIRKLLDAALPIIEKPPSGVRFKIDIDPLSML